VRGGEGCGEGWSEGAGEGCSDGGLVGNDRCEEGAFTICRVRGDMVMPDDPALVGTNCSVAEGLTSPELPADDSSRGDNEDTPDDGDDEANTGREGGEVRVGLLSDVAGPAICTCFCC
jgi:hypothetical protein